MSPGATFERVYTELRRMLAEGELPPGSPIEPAAVGRQIASSITPVRDALHRLTGERLVEAPNHNGFRVPLITEAELRDLYQWHAQLLILAARQIRPSQAAVEATGPSLGEEPASAMTTLVNRRPKRTPYRRAKGTPFVEQRDGYDGRTVRAGCGVGRA
jgi:hypothetical protein